MRLIDADDQLNNTICLLKPSNASESGSRCNFVVSAENNTVIRLEGCQKADSGSDRDKRFCSTIIDKSRCYLSVETSNFIEHEPLNWPRQHANCERGGRQAQTSLKISSVSINKALSVFKDINGKLSFNNFLLENINLGINLKELLSSNFNEKRQGDPKTRLKRIVMKRIKTDLGITDGTFDQADYPFLRSVVIEDSKIAKFSKGAFKMGNEFQELTLQNLVSKDGLLAQEAIKLSCSKSSPTQLKIIIDGSELTPAAWERDFISIEKDNCNNGYLRLELTVTGNLFEDSLSEEIFSGFVSKFTGGNNQLNFTYDKIACCSSDNRWLFRTNLTESKNIRLLINCSDIDDDVYKYRNGTELDRVCETQNSKPILIIIICSILLLIILLGGSSLICIYYVLPKTGAVVIINSKLRFSASSGFKSSAAAETTSTATDVTQATQATRHPLMSSGPKEDNQTTRSALKSASLNSLPLKSSNPKSSNPKSSNPKSLNPKSVSKSLALKSPVLKPSLKSSKSSTASTKSQPAAPALREKVLRSNRQQDRPHKQ